MVAFSLKLYGRKGFKDAESLIPPFCVKIKSYIFLIFVFSNYVLLFYSSPPVQEEPSAYGSAGLSLRDIASGPYFLVRLRV